MDWRLAGAMEDLFCKCKALNSNPSPTPKKIFIVEKDLLKYNHLGPF
jgi:hypothetical protein